MSKNLLLMKEVVTKYHPSFVNSKDLTKYALAQPHIFDVPRLVEETFAAIGGYNFVDAFGQRQPR